MVRKGLFFLILFSSSSFAMDFSEHFYQIFQAMSWVVNNQAEQPEKSPQHIQPSLVNNTRTSSKVVKTPQANTSNSSTSSPDNPRKTVRFKIPPSCQA